MYLDLSKCCSALCAAVSSMHICLSTPPSHTFHMPVACLSHAFLEFSHACRMPFACLSRIFHMPFTCLSQIMAGWIVVPAMCQVADHPGSVIDGLALTLAGTHIITHPPTLSLACTSFNDSPIHSLIIESIKCIMLSCLS